MTRFSEVCVFIEVLKDEEGMGIVAGVFKSCGTVCSIAHSTEVLRQPIPPPPLPF
eukprot:CAMPEP_0179490790 /NCGR_PEP_ID=MMETSP0799-20121207/65685_1 /TAXON_ID=46947 /ORGANISM="Geminigera cryophila, Strain CCMP2564" /LENGTH=54 /DNA_ID=CAMNT_0021307083 /DNA_START=47 /DNA_END=208 /DNA_ORIENTATION=+